MTGWDVDCRWARLRQNVRTLFRRFHARTASGGRDFPAFLYHGTALDNLSEIERRGLRGRKGTGNFPSLQSHPGFTYLTSVAPLHYVSQAVGMRGLGVILRVPFSRLPQRLLYPDEDFLAQDVVFLEAEKSGVVPDRNALLQATKAAQPSNERERWRDSLIQNGTVLVDGGVPWKWIDAYATIDLSQINPLLLMPLVRNVGTRSQPAEWQALREALRRIFETNDCDCSQVRKTGA